MRQAEVHHNLLHLRLHLLLRQTLQTCIKPDVFLHGEPGTHREEHDLELVSYYFGIHITTKLLKCVSGGNVHAKEDVMLRTHAQVLAYSAQIGADVFALDVSSA